MSSLNARIVEIETCQEQKNTKACARDAYVVVLALPVMQDNASASRDTLPGDRLLFKSSTRVLYRTTYSELVDMASTTFTSEDYVARKQEPPGNGNAKILHYRCRIQVIDQNQRQLP